MKDKDQILSAQVVLRSATGARPDGQALITSENIRDYLPTDETVTRAQRAFKALGFEIGPMVGNSFSITAPASTIEQVFKTKIRREGTRGGVKASESKGSGSYELPVSQLPSEIARDVEAVTFSPPPDFGPGNV